MNLLTNNSLLSEHPKDIDISLKTHQLAMLQRCIDIENIPDNKFGIMSDKPGTGKTYVILSLIYKTIETNKINIIVVPQNIYKQWTNSIELFNKKISYKKFIEYENIMSLYLNPKILLESDIIITTSSYYHIIATTINSLNISVDRVFFDEIDSISNIICTNINSNFLWFISASFNKDYVGYFKNKLDKNLDIITCKCDSDFIDENIYLGKPIKKYYLCKNIYIDYILGSVVSIKELRGLNAMDYTLYKQDFQNYKAKNEREVIELILDSRKKTVLFDKNQLEDSKEKIKFYEKFIDKEYYQDELKKKIDKLYFINDFKINVLDLISNFDSYIDHKTCNLKTIRITLDDIIDIIYNFDDFNETFNNYFINKIKNISIDNLIANLNKLLIIIDSVIEFCDKEKDFKNYLNELIESFNNFDNSLISEEKIKMNQDIIEIYNKNIKENEDKITLIYKRLEENNCCSTCYDELNNSNTIYITSECCNNKVCEDCFKKWYFDMKKESCIYCNKDKVNFNTFLFYENENFKDKHDDKHENNSIKNSEKIDLINYNENKYFYLKDFIYSLKEIEKKVIIFSDFPNIFHDIECICNENGINYVDLDKGNIKDIDYSVNEYKYGNAKVLLSNSTLFGCGMNLENSTDIIFVHKMEESIERQVIGRAQRLGRKSILNIIYLQYENECEYIEKKYTYDNYYIDQSVSKNDQLSGYYAEKQFYNILENINNLNIGTNNVNELEGNLTIINDLPKYDHIIDVNLEELITSLH